MKIFVCGACGQTLYFHNVECNRCGHALGFVPERLELMAFEAAGPVWRAAGEAAAGTFRKCANYADYDACNWMVAATDGRPLCRACRLNRVIPDLAVARNRRLWRRLQQQKNRLVYALLRLGLPVVDRQSAPDGLAFDLLAGPAPDVSKPGPGDRGAVAMGHAHGVITLDIAEADDALREQARQDMAEPYRTILGHFRHESGHFYWDRLVRGGRWLGPFRARFGDERQNYAEALSRHYDSGPPADWASRFVSAYASSHPWEDWAESWAHYLHIVDTLETAWQFGLHLSPRVEQPGKLSLEATFDPYAVADFRTLVDRWLPLTVALNCLNHSMGQGDAYPFVLSEPAIDKLGVVHDVIRHPQGPFTEAT